MNTLYNTKQNQEAIAFFNSAASTVVNNSMALWAQQVDYVKKNADRNLSHLMEPRQFTSPQEVFDYQRQVGETELKELKKAGESYYAAADKAGRDLMGIAVQGQALAESAFADAADKISGAFPKGFDDLAKTTHEFFQNGVEAAAKFARNGAPAQAEAPKALKSKAGK